MSAVIGWAVGCPLGVDDALERRHQNGGAVRDRDLHGPIGEIGIPVGGGWVDDDVHQTHPGNEKRRLAQTKVLVVDGPVRLLVALR